MGEKPIAAFVLSLIGGIISVLYGITLVAKWASLFGGTNDTIFGIYSLILGILTMLVAFIMYIKPSSTRTWGIIIITLSIISGVNILSLIGGILAIKWKSSEALPPPPPPPP